jgi:hypothetical protein
MRFRDLLTAFDEALDWSVDDPFLADHLPPSSRELSPSPERPLVDA